MLRLFRQEGLHFVRKHSKILGLAIVPIVGPLAQLVEHRTFNPLVVRSSRTRPTIFPRDSSLGAHRAVLSL